MKIAFILHALSLTGAPKIGVDMAAIMAKEHDVYLVSKKDGPLREFAEQHGFIDFQIIATSHECEPLSLSNRVLRYIEYLEVVSPDYVYINSVASADWAAACRQLRIPFALHIHEMSGEIKSLQNIGIFRTSDIHSAHLLVSASEECGNDARVELKLENLPIFDFGVGIDAELIKIKSAEAPPQALNAFGATLDLSDLSSRRPRRIMMCGVACERKGSDLFWELAKLCPEYDFVWVGPWDDEIGMPINPAILLNETHMIPNLYWTNMLSNPYPAISSCDLLMLSSRDDPNPLVVPEAISLGIPVCTFADTGGSRIWTERYGFSLSGSVDVLRMKAFLERYFENGGGEFELSSQFFEDSSMIHRMRILLDRILSPE